MLRTRHTLTVFLLVCLGVCPVICGEELPRLTTLSNPAQSFERAAKPYVVMRRGEVRVVVVNNEAVDDFVPQIKNPRPWRDEERSREHPNLVQTIELTARPTREILIEKNCVTVVKKILKFWLCGNGETCH